MSISTIATYVSLIIGTTGILLAVYFYYRPRIYKALEVSPLANVSVIEIKEPVSDLRILHKNREIDELYVLTFQLENSGNQDIKAEDIVVPFQCSTGAEIVDAKLIGKDPEDCDLEIDRFEKDKVYFKTELFKTGEKATVKLTLLAAPKLSFEGNRIADLGRITISEPSDRRWLSWFLAFIATLSIAIAMYTYKSLPPKHRIIASFESQALAGLKDPLSSIGITFQGKSIKSLHQVFITIANTGRSVIGPKDFDGPIRVTTRGKILNLEGPAEASISVLNDDTIIIEPFLINPNEVIGITFFVDGEPQVKINGKVAGGLVVK